MNISHLPTGFPPLTQIYADKEGRRDSTRYGLRSEAVLYAQKRIEEHSLSPHDSSAERVGRNWLRSSSGTLICSWVSSTCIGSSFE